MMNKFIKFKSDDDEVYIIPHMISHVVKQDRNKYGIHGQVVIYLFSGKEVYVNENIDEVLKKIKDADSIKFNL